MIKKLITGLLLIVLASTILPPVSALAVRQVDYLVVGENKYLPGEEIIELRDQYSETVSTGGGNLSKRIYLGSINYETAVGGYYPIQTEILPSSKSYWDWEVEAGHWQLYIKNDTTVQIKKSGNWVGQRLHGIAYLDVATKNYEIIQTVVDQIPTVEGNTITWSDLLYGVDLVIKYTNDSFKEDIVIKQALRDILNTPGYRPADYGLNTATTYLVPIFEMDWSASLPMRLKGGAAVNPDEAELEADIYFESPVKDKYFDTYLTGFMPLDYAVSENPTNPQDPEDEWEYASAKIRKRLITKNGKHWLLLGVPVATLNQMPEGNIIFDPTETLRPDGAGDETNIGYASPTVPHWQNVDDVDSDGTSTMIRNYHVNSYERDLYNIPASSGSDEINFIKVYINAERESQGGVAKASIKSGGTVADGSEIALTIGWTLYSQQWNTNPDDAAAWEWADIDALQIGVSLNAQGTSSGYSARATQVYVEVDYTVIDPPTVTTQAASSIEDTTATGNGNITDTGGEDAGAWGIVWNTTGNPDTGDNVAAGSGSGGTGAFTASLTSLPTGTTIHTKAYATNDGGTGYGSEQDFLTKPAAPTSVSATDGSDSSKVVITWTKSTGATGYKVYEGANLLDTLGDVATYDDTNAPAGTITSAGTPTASDGTNQAYVTLSLAGESTANGAARTYKVVAFNATGDSDDSSTDTGYRSVGSITYQWQRSAADSDASYGNIGGGTTDPYNDTGAPAYPAARWFRAVVSAVDASNSPQTSAGERGWKGPLLPTVTTQAASSVEETTATGNGNITDTGGLNADERGVEWDTDSGAPYTYSATDEGSFGTGAFTKGMTSLDPGTTYYYRAKAHNSAGWSYGGEQTFYTKPGDPGSLGDTDRTATSIDLSWTKGSGAEKTMVRYRTDQYPTGTGDGTQAYFDTSNSTTVGGLSNGQIYYFRAWGWDTNSGYSDGYSQDTAYTWPGDPSALTATTASDTQVDLTWSKGTGGDKTMVRRKTGSYPTDESDGSQVYFDTDNSTSDTGRSANTLYFYRIWSYGTDSTYYSDGYSQDSTTTYGPPDITTDNATSVEESTLTWNGDLTATNGANSITRGFEWDIDSGAPYDNTWTESGSFGTGAFTRSVVGLAKGELYYYRTKATNTYGTGYGSELTVLTKPDKPSSFAITAPESGTQLDLTWDKGDGALNTYIRGKDGSYPTDRSDGYLVYNDTGESTSDTGLVGGHTYYYKAWGYATEGGKEQYSDLFDNAFGTPGLAPKLWIIWEHGATFTDLTGNDNDATPTFRTASSSANVSAVLLSFGPVSPSEIATYTLTDTYAVLSGNVTSSSGMYTDLDLSKLPAAPITELLTEAGVPAAAWWFPFLFLGICVVGLLTYGATTITRGPKGSLREGSIDGSLLTQFIVMEFALVVSGFMGPIPLWPSFLFPIAGVSLILSRKHLAWG